jgi:hypothetical protein
LLCLPVNDQTEGKEEKAKNDGKHGGSSREAERDPAQPENGSQHREGEDFFESVHPSTRFREELQEDRKQRKKENRKGKTKSERGEDDKSTHGRKGEGGSEGDAHEGCGTGGGNSNGEESGGECAGPSLTRRLVGEAAEQDLKFKNSEEVEGECVKESEEKPYDGGRL